MNSNPKDLLYTNKFMPSEILSNSEVQNAANNFTRYQELRNKDINNIETYVNDKVFTQSKATLDKLKSEGWNQGNLGNQRPILSNTTRDLVSDSYFQYRISYVNIDSRQRDMSKYLKPNNYEMYLNKQFENVVMMRLIDYNFPNYLFPINRFNNTLVWFTPTPRVLNSPYYQGEVIEEFVNNNPECNIFLEEISQYCFNKQGKMKQYSFKIWDAKIDNFTMTNCTYKITIPPGYYSTEELEKTIREEWSKQVFFQSTLFSEGYPYNQCFLPPQYADCKTLQEDSNYFNIAYIASSQLIYVSIDPVKSKVEFILRLEELKIKKMQSYRGKNYIDITLDIDPSSFTEFQVLCNNYSLPLVATDLPGIGGLNQKLINKIEYVPYCYMYRLQNNPYYQFLENESCDCEGNPNVIRLYLYNDDNQCMIASFTETIEKKCECDLLTKAVIGREQPFLFLTQQNSFTEFYNVPFTDKNYTPILSENFCNLDGSSKSLLNVLGFFIDTQNNISLSSSYFARGIMTNLDESRTLLDQALNYFYKNIVQADIDLYTNPQPNFLTDLIYDPPVIPSKLLNVYLAADGKYYFNNEDYVFLRLISTQYGGTLGGNIIQGISNASDGSNVGGSDSIYENYLDYIDGISFKTLKALPNTNPDDLYKLFNCSPSVVDSDGITNYIKNPPLVSVKDLSNLFCKIRISNIPQSGSFENILQSETEFYNTSIGKLDTLKVQFLDFEGKLLDLRHDHNFVLLIVEKLEKLKETNINSRTGFVDNIGDSFTFTH